MQSDQTLLTKARHLLTTFADWLAIAVAATIAILSFLPHSTAAGVPVNDLVNHFIAYCVLSGLALYRRGTVIAGAIALASVVALGGVIEVVQPHFGRAGELYDFAANGLGALAGAALTMIVRRLGRPNNPIRR